MKLLSNIFALLIGFTIIFLVRRISPGEQQEKEKARRSHRISITLLVTLAIALAIYAIILLIKSGENPRLYKNFSCRLSVCSGATMKIIKKLGLNSNTF